jgi:hypothetical protein
MQTYHLTPSAGIYTLTKHGSSVPMGEYRSRSQALTACARDTLGHEATLEIRRQDGSVATNARLPLPIPLPREDFPGWDDGQEAHFKYE